MQHIQERHERIKTWIYQVADKIKQSLNEEQLAIEEKSGANDLVTNIDKETETYLINQIRYHYPEDKIVSEEGFGDKVTSLQGTVWFIDPIDGTLNFVKQKENFAIMIAVYQDGVGVQSYIYEVMKDKLYHVIKGKGLYCNGKQINPILTRRINEGLISFNSGVTKMLVDGFLNPIVQQSLGVRMYGAAGIGAVEVACGRITAYLSDGLQPWDLAAGKLMIEEVGGKVSNYKGEELDLLNPKQIIFANSAAHAEIVQELKNSKY